MPRTLEPPPGLRSDAQLELLRASLAAAEGGGGRAPGGGRGRGGRTQGGRLGSARRKGPADASESGGQQQAERGSSHAKGDRGAGGTEANPTAQNGGNGARGAGLAGPVGPGGKRADSAGGRKRGSRGGQSQHTSGSAGGTQLHPPIDIPRRDPKPKGAGRKQSQSNAEPAGNATPSGAEEHKRKARTKKGRFKEHWGQADLQRGMKTGAVFRAQFRCNANNRTEAYVSVVGLPVDVLIKGLTDQNRAVVGDEVAVHILPREQWYEQLNQDAEGDAGAAPTSGIEEKESGEEVETETEESGEETLAVSEAAGSPEAALRSMSQFLLANPRMRPRGRVVAILQKAARRERVIGSLMSEANGIATLVPSDPRMPRMMVKMHTLPQQLVAQLTEDCHKPAGVPHHLVSARLVAWEAGQITPLAQVRESIGQAGEIETETAAILAAEGIEEADFSQDVIDCLPESPWEVTQTEIDARRDFRSVRVFTIDPLTARDLDDALSVERLDNGLLRIGVHIADVTHFVKPDTALDEEAASRCTSVYLVQRVIPMLPHLLCQELCSLNPGVDRLAFSAVWDMTPEGNIESQWLGRTVIRSCVKLAYEHAQRIIDGDFTASDGEDPIPMPLQEPHTWKEVVDDVLCLAKVARNLRTARFDSGALRLDNIKLYFALDGDGNPCGATPHVQREANQTIEEFMLLANRSVAKFISDVFPDRALLRRHPSPDQRQLEGMQEMMAKMGIHVDIDSSGALHSSLVQLREQLEPAAVDIVTQQATKPMKLAEYFCTGPSRDAPESWRHYALAMSHYTHFTSPIRRYPDVVVHRVLAAALDHTVGGHSKEEAAARFGLRDEERTGEVALHANATKLAAKNAQDASLKIYLCVLLKSHPMVLLGTLLPMGGNRFFVAYVGALGVEVRVQVNEIHGCGDANFNKATGELALAPKSGIGGSATPEGFAYELPELSNPQGLLPVRLPLELRPMMSVPLVLTSATSGSGRPSSVVAKLYVATT